ncbi:PP2C family protein-serine/threonine phosphatase [Streptomyces sp. NPDC047453]|uniref:PP2C family protein-serine/threonine phosphatase n=1 Tax=Streptomyces sp. NPDC047453 TaxID=3154812 RepID=UPI0033D2D92A
MPILGGTERLGVLRVDLAQGVEPERAGVLASLVGLLLMSKRPHSDSYARLVRTEAMNVAAEMQWNLMPPLCFANHAVAIVAAMEPAYAIGGDAFDYAVAGHQVHLAVYDAMGHNSRAGLTANLAVAACRNQCRQGIDLVATGENVEEVLVEHFGHSTYVTAVLANLDFTTGALFWINRGHPAPVLIRGGRWTTTLGCPPAHPLGTELDVPATFCREQLEPGDRILLYTDGVTEARDRCGREFGLDGLTDFMIRHRADGLPFPETLRRLTHAIVDHHAGQRADDATVLCLEWFGPSRNTELRPQGTSSPRTPTRLPEMGHHHSAGGAGAVPDEQQPREERAVRSAWVCGHVEAEVRKRLPNAVRGDIGQGSAEPVKGRHGLPPLPGARHPPSQRPHRSGRPPRSLLHTGLREDAPGPPLGLRPVRRGWDGRRKPEQGPPVAARPARPARPVRAAAPGGGALIRRCVPAPSTAAMSAPVG